MTTGKTIDLTIQTFVGRVMSLLFNTLSRFVIVFLPRSNRLLILWLQSPSAVTLEPEKRKSVATSTFSFSLCQEVMANITVALNTIYLVMTLNWYLPQTSPLGWGCISSCLQDSCTYRYLICISSLACLMLRSLYFLQTYSFHSFPYLG